MQLYKRMHRHLPARRNVVPQKEMGAEEERRGDRMAEAVFIHGTQCSHARLALTTNPAPSSSGYFRLGFFP